MQPIGNIVSKAIRMYAVELLNLYPSAIDPPARVKLTRRTVRAPGCIAIHALFDTTEVNVEAYSARAAARAVVLSRAVRGTAPEVAASACRALWPRCIAPPGIADESLHSSAVSASSPAFCQSVRPIRSPFARFAH